MAGEAASGDINALTLAVGELKGQMRELIHTGNNTAQKVDGMAQIVFAGRDLPTAFIELSKRVDELEADRHRRDGATGVLSGILQSKAFGVLVTAVLSVLGALAAIKGGLFK